jgi:hypothetical protein
MGCVNCGKLLRNRRLGKVEELGREAAFARRRAATDQCVRFRNSSAVDFAARGLSWERGRPARLSVPDPGTSARSPLATQLRC